MVKEIKTPRGVIVVGKNGRAELKFNANFGRTWTRRYSEAQSFVDSTVLARCEPYTPKLTGMLILSGSLGTEIGSGEVKWIAPYSRKQYYLRRKPGTQTGPLRGPYWFHRMKSVHGTSIIEGAKKIAGGKKDK